MGPGLAACARRAGTSTRAGAPDRAPPASDSLASGCDTGPCRLAPQHRPPRARARPRIDGAAFGTRVGSTNFVARAARSPLAPASTPVVELPPGRIFPTNPSLELPPL